MNRTPILFLHVFIIATCGLVYELLAGTLASYVLGDSITQFSLVIGVYLFALGVGAWLSRFVETAVARCFIEVELGVALLGGASAPLLFLSFARIGWFYVILFGVVFLIGVLVGLELPLLMRIIKDQLEFKELVSRVLAFDYVGALVASILFPILFVPKLGLHPMNIRGDKVAAEAMRNESHRPIRATLQEAVSRRSPPRHRFANKTIKQRLCNFVE